MNVKDFEANQMDNSAANSVKLDRLIILLEGGGPDSPGLLHRHNNLAETIYGKPGNGWGIAAKVGIMWRVHIWLLCSASAVVGWLLKAVVKP